MKKITVLFMVLMISLVAYGCSTQTSSSQITSVKDVPAAIKMQIEQDAKKAAVREAIDNYYQALPKVNNRIDPQDVYAKIKEDPNSIFILDIRDLKGDRNKVPGAYHCYWYEVGKIIDKLPKDKTIITHCWTGQAGMQVAVTLRLLGYDAWAMNGGWQNGWVKENLPTEKYKETGDPFVFDDLSSKANMPAVAPTTVEPAKKN